jgi:ABC-2 type transport system ATP-binding protein
MTAIETVGLSKYYGETRGIEDLTLSVEEGEVFGFLGPNGAGKTTTIRTLMGFQSPTAGTAAVLGADIRDERALREARRHVGYLPGDPGLDENVTGHRLIEYFGALRGDTRSEELLEVFDPPLERKVGEYSRGNKQMLGLILAFMHDPDLVIMDEPTSGLDPLKQEQFYEFVRREQEQGKTFFFSSHILSEVRKICDRVGIIRNGQLVELENVQTLLSRSGKLVKISVAGTVEPSDFAIPGVHDLTVGGEPVPVHADGGAATGTLAGDETEATTVSFTYTGAYNTLLEHLTAYTLFDLEIEEAPLEDVFMRFYGEEADDV